MEDGLAIWLRQLERQPLEVLADRAARCEQPLVVGRLLSGAAPGHLRVAFVQAFSELIRELVTPLADTLVGVHGDPRERIVSALLVAAEALARGSLATSREQVLAVARGTRTLDDAVRALDLAELERAVAHADPGLPDEPAGQWTVDDLTAPITVPLWPRLELVCESEPHHDDELLRERIRRELARMYRMPAADRTLVLAFYRRWAVDAGWRLTGSEIMGHELLELRRPLELAERPQIDLDIGPDTLTITVRWIKPVDVEAMLAELKQP